MLLHHFRILQSHGKDVSEVIPCGEIRTPPRSQSQASTQDGIAGSASLDEEAASTSTQQPSSSSHGMHGQEAAGASTPKSLQSLQSSPQDRVPVIARADEDAETSSVIHMHREASVVMETFHLMVSYLKANNLWNCLAMLLAESAKRRAVYVHLHGQQLQGEDLTPEFVKKMCDDAVPDPTNSKDEHTAATSQDLPQQWSEGSSWVEQQEMAGGSSSLMCEEGSAGSNLRFQNQSPIGSFWDLQPEAEYSSTPGADNGSADAALRMLNLMLGGKLGDSKGSHAEPHQTGSGDPTPELGDELSACGSLREMQHELSKVSSWGEQQEVVGGSSSMVCEEVSADSNLGFQNQSPTGSFWDLQPEAVAVQNLEEQVLGGSNWGLHPKGAGGLIGIPDNTCADAAFFLRKLDLIFGVQLRNPSGALHQDSDGYSTPCTPRSCMVEVSTGCGGEVDQKQTRCLNWEDHQEVAGGLELGLEEEMSAGSGEELHDVAAQTYGPEAQVHQEVAEGSKLQVEWSGDSGWELPSGAFEGSMGERQMKVMGDSDRDQIDGDQIATPRHAAGGQEAGRATPASLAFAIILAILGNFNWAT
eukprot:gene27245-2500_t